MSEETPENNTDLNLYQEMRCGILTNAKGEILIVHDEPLKSDIQWIEYAPKERSFSIVYEDGVLQDLGIDFNQTVKDNLLQGQEVTLALMVDKKIVSAQKTVFVIREY